MADRRRTGVSVHESLGVVKADPVNAVLLQPKRRHAVHIVFGGLLFVIEIVPPAVRRVRTHRIKPRAVRRSTVIHWVPVHVHQRILPEGVVKNHVRNDGNALAVAGIHKLLELFGRSVVLIQRHVEARIIAPALVVLKLAVGHQLDGVDTQALQVAQRVNERLVVSGGDKIAHQQFINNQIGFAGRSKRRILPRVLRRTRTKQRAKSRGFSRRIRMQPRPSTHWNSAVGIGIQHQFGKRISHLNATVDPVLVSVLLASHHRNRQPKTLAVRALVHEVARRRQKVVKIAQHIDKLLERRPQNQAHCAVVEVVGAIQPALRNRSHHLNGVTRVVNRVVGCRCSRNRFEHHGVGAWGRRDQVIVERRGV